MAGDAKWPPCPALPSYSRRKKAPCRGPRQLEDRRAGREEGVEIRLGPSGPLEHNRLAVAFSKGFHGLIGRPDFEIRISCRFHQQMQVTIAERARNITNFPALPAV